MSTKWTTEQQKAIEERNNNILVSAAAGSGKTAVLVQRVVDMVTDKANPVYINRLLVATFTNAAAAEMKERIYQALQEKIKQNPDDSFIKEQLVLLGQAQISTVHSFCINLIRENFHLLGIRHDFDIADEVRLSAIRKKALEEVFERKYNEGDVDFNNTVDAFGGKRDDKRLAEIVITVYKFAESLPHPEKWLQSCWENLLDESFVKKFKEDIDEGIRKDISDILLEYDKAIEIIESDEGLSSYIDSFTDDYNIFQKIMNSKSDDIVDEIRNFKFKLIGRKKSNADPVNTLYVKSIRDAAREKLEDIQKVFCYKSEEIADEIKLMIPFVKTVSSLVLDFKSTFASMKRAENLLDFNDMEHYAIKLLEENDDLREHLKGFYTEILVDEYQDTNGVQAHLFALLSNGKNLFTVGDVKQSIYSFRNSNPKYFLEKYNLFDFNGSEHGVKINLSRNFRSSNAIISAINSFFENIMIEEIGGVSYNEEHALVYGNDSIKDVDNSVERYIINTSKSVNDGIASADIQVSEAVFVANRIRQIVEVEKTEIFDKKENRYRPVTYKDIVVLMRKTKDTSSLYAKVFSERDIPVYTEESGGYFNHIEIATVMSFMKIIENPLQDIPLLAVMRSPIFGFDDNFVADIRAQDKNSHLYDLLKNNDDSKVIDFINKIDELREFSRYNNIGALVRKIVFDTGYYYFVGNLSNGNVRMLNLNLLCERAVSFSSKGHKTVSDFISYVKSMIESGNEYSSPKFVGEDNNCVRIMSIHKSKGLEFPIVFLSETAKSYNKNDFKNPFTYDETYGLAMNIIDVDRRVKYNPFYKRAICIKKDDELIAEEIRLLYVALTRAKYKLVITGSLAYKGEECDFDSSAYRIKMKNKYLDLLLAKNKYISDPVIYNVLDVYEMDNSVTSKECETILNSDYSEFYDEISKRLDFSYQYPENKYIPSKKSISEYVSDNGETILNRISLSDTKLTPAQKGTLVHFVLQNIDLSDVSDISSVDKQIEQMIEKGFFGKEYKSIIDINSIFNFFISDIGKRMLASEKVYREFKFCVDIPANELGYDTDKETVLMQGVIDCCFLENDEFVIIDYKTGSLSDKYKMQIELYKKCLEISTGKKVKETHICPLI